MSKSRQILKLLQSGKSVKEIAQRLKVKPQYVDTVRSKNKSSKILKAVKETKAALNVLENKPDLVNKPPHYTVGGVDFLDYAEAKGLTENAYLFNVVKYVSRAGKKVGANPVEDLKKAQFYLTREIAIRERA